MATVSQEYFDNVVLENVSDFDLTWEEAVVQALEELKMQNINNIGHLHTVPVEKRETGPNLLQLLKGDVESLKRLTKTCQSSEPESTRFAREGGCQQLMALLDECVDKGNIDAVIACCEVVRSLSSHRNVTVLTSLRSSHYRALQLCPDNITVIRATRCLALGSERWTARFVENGSLSDVVQSLKCSLSDITKFAEACALTRTIVSTEDESEIGDVLGRCRTLCGSKDAQVSTLPSLKTEDGSTAVTLLCSVIQEKKGELEYVRVASKSLKTLARTDDVVETMRQHNVVETAIFLLQDYCWDQETAVSLLGLLRNLCANERCREQAMKAGAAKVVISLLKAYPGDMSIQEPGCGCVAAMSLRNADFALQLAEAGGVKVIFNVIAEHSDRLGAAKAACLAVRNLGSRNLHVRQEIKSFPEAETHIRAVSEKQPRLKDFVHAALREFDMLADTEYNCPFGGLEAIRRNGRN